MSNQTMPLVADWIQLQLCFDHAQEVEQYRAELQAEESEFELTGFTDELDEGNEVGDHWLENLGPFDLARAMIYEAVRDIILGNKKNKESAISWILDDSEEGLPFPICVQWMTENFVEPGASYNLVLPEALEDRVEQVRQACLKRPQEMFHLLKNYEAWTQYSKMKLEALKASDLPDARELYMSSSEERVEPWMAMGEKP